MKKILFILILACGSWCHGIFAQTIVWDITAMETLIANHKVQHEAFKKLKDEEGQIAALQKSIAEKMTQIEYFHSKLYNSLKSIEAFTKTGKDIIYAGDIVADIGKYQQQMLEYAFKDPALSLVAVKAQSQLITRTSNLMEYIWQAAVVGTDVNLMDNQQRMDLLKHVITELRIMRGLAFGIVVQMKAAMRNGVFQTLLPGVFKYQDNRSKLVEQVLEDFNPKPKGKK
jgi:hypothetical protein